VIKVVLWFRNSAVQEMFSLIMVLASWRIRLFNDGIRRIDVNATVIKLGFLPKISLALMMPIRE